jgi:hypothetical protein
MTTVMVSDEMARRLVTGSLEYQFALSTGYLHVRLPSRLSLDDVSDTKALLALIVGVIEKLASANAVALDAPDETAAPEPFDKGSGAPPE